MLGAGGRIGPSQADPVDLDAHADELPGVKTAPVLIGTKRECDALGRLVVDGRHLGPHVAGEQQRTDELDVAVNAMRIGQRLEQARVQQTAPEAARADLAGSEDPGNHDWR
jgi:hypothetical protein